jgi:hypothetical protein
MIQVKIYQLEHLQAALPHMFGCNLPDWPELSYEGAARRSFNRPSYNSGDR